MIDVEWLSRLVKTLKDSGVTSFKTADVELVFGAQSQVEPSSAPSPATEFSIEGQLPVDLRSDAITDHDKVLNWSAPPSPQDEMPGANDLPLNLTGEAL